MFKRAFAQRGLAPVVLSRAIGASGTPTSALIPWNSCGGLYGSDSRRGHAELFAVCGFQRREPAAGHRNGVCRRADV